MAAPPLPYLSLSPLTIFILPPLLSQHRHPLVLFSSTSLLTPATDEARQDQEVPHSSCSAASASPSKGVVRGHSSSRRQWRRSTVAACKWRIGGRMACSYVRILGFCGCPKWRWSWGSRRWPCLDDGARWRPSSPSHNH